MPVGLLYIMARILEREMIFTISGISLAKKDKFIF